MESINQVTLSGNLTRNGELRYTNTGVAVLELGIAFNASRKNQQTGEYEDIANFIDCTVLGNRAVGLNQYMLKGTPVVVQGRLQWNQWVDKNSGQNRSKITLLVDKVNWYSRPDSQPQSAPQAARQPQGYQQQPYQQQPQPYAQQPAQQPYTPPLPEMQREVQQFVREQKAAARSYYDEDIPF